jgi:F-type H+-transporting ATPase subunit delta
MNETTVFKRYGEAFLSYAKDSDLLDQAVREIVFVRKIIENDDNFLGFLYSMEISNAEKLELFTKAFTDLCEPVSGLIKLLIERGRIKNLPEVCLAIENLQKNRIESECRIRSSFSIDEASLLLIKTKLEKKLKRKLRVVTEVDKNLIAGIQVVVDNVIIDGTLKHRLSELKEKLLAVKVI